MDIKIELNRTPITKTSGKLITSTEFIGQFNIMLGLLDKKPTIQNLVRFEIKGMANQIHSI